MSATITRHARHRRRRAGPQPADAGALRARRSRDRTNPRGDRVLSGEAGRPRLSAAPSRSTIPTPSSNSWAAAMPTRSRPARRRSTSRSPRSICRRTAKSSFRRSPTRDALADHSQPPGAARRRQRARHFNMGPEQFVARITPKTRAVMLVHSLGRAADVIGMCRRGSRAQYQGDRGLQPVARRARQRPADRQFRRHRRVLDHVPEGPHDRRRRRRSVHQRHRPPSPRARHGRSRQAVMAAAISTTATRTSSCSRRSTSTPTKSPAPSALPRCSGCANTLLKRLTFLAELTGRLNDRAKSASRSAIRRTMRRSSIRSSSMSSASPAARSILPMPCSPRVSGSIRTTAIWCPIGLG